MIFVYLLIIISLQCLVQNEIIFHQLLQFNTHTVISIAFSDKHVNRFFNIDLSNQHSYTFLPFLQPSSTSSHTITNITIDNTQYNAVQINETFYISTQNKIINTYIYYIQHTNEMNVNTQCLSLCFNYSNEHDSLIHIMYMNKVIDYKSFAFDFGNVSSPMNVYQHKIYFGNDIPTDVFINKPYKYKCKVISGSSKWKCNLSKVNYKFSTVEMNYHITKTMYFQANDYKILAPDDFMYSIRNIVMERFINKGICIEYNNVFECKCSDDDLYNTFPNITFTIDGIEHIMKSKELFYKNNEGKCTFIIERNGLNEWILGTMFYKKYFTVFDYEQSEIIFYSDTQLNNNNNNGRNTYTTSSSTNNNLVIIALLKVIITLLTITIFVLIIVHILSK